MRAKATCYLSPIADARLQNAFIRRIIGPISVGYTMTLEYPEKRQRQDLQVEQK